MAIYQLTKDLPLKGGNKSKKVPISLSHIYGWFGEISWICKILITYMENYLNDTRKRFTGVKFRTDFYSYRWTSMLYLLRICMRDKRFVHKEMTYRKSSCTKYMAMRSLSIRIVMCW